MKYFDTLSPKQLNELLDKACSLLISLEQEAMDHNPDYIDTELATAVNEFFKEVNTANEDPGPEYDSAGFTEEDRIVNGQYRNYVETVKHNIDKATEEGLLRDSSDYNYMQKETFIKRMETDKEFAAYWADQQAQDFDTFGANKI